MQRNLSLKFVFLIVRVSRFVLSYILVIIYMAEEMMLIAFIISCVLSPG